METRKSRQIKGKKKGKEISWFVIYISQEEKKEEGNKE